VVACDDDRQAQIEEMVEESLRREYPILSSRP